jgi:hypothetical protein
MSAMRKWIPFTPLFALLAGAIWFAIVGGVGFSLLVGGGLMALIFYSNRHGYDDLSGGDSGRM